MSASVPTTEPVSLRAGDTWQWTRTLADYPADTWALTYYFRNASAHFDVTATGSGTTYTINVAKATTAGKTAGWYDWVAVATSSTERFEVGRGRLEILPDFSAAANLDGRSFARKVLDYIEAAILGRATADQLDVVNATMADRGITRDKAGLITLRSQFLAEVRREENAARISAGLGSRNRLVVRFGA